MAGAPRPRMKKPDKPPITTSEADLQAFALPCANETHDPFSLDFLDAPGGLVFPHAWVRTTSWAWDGCGGRTDLHEMFGLLWALLLRARGVASAAFLDEGGFAGPDEIYARALLFLQPFDRFFAQSDTRLKDSLRAHTAAVAHDLYTALEMTDLSKEEPTWQEETLPWLETVRTHLGLVEADEFFVERSNPNWRYYSIPRKGMSWLQLHPKGMAFLRYACRFYEPVTLRQGNRLVISSGGLFNAVPFDALRKAERALQAVDKSQMAVIGDGRGQWNSDQAMVIPLENRLVVLGGHFLVCVPTLCGYRAYVDARHRWEEKNRSAALMFGVTGTIEWQETIDSARFEVLVEALLREEPNVLRVRSAGPHTERDQGRDLIVDRAGVVFADDQAVTGRERLLVQVKTRNRTIGKSDVRDIRDTIDYHQANGYLLVAYPKLSGDLINHLERLQEHGVQVDWWTMTQIEERLRLHPNLAAQFSDLLVHRPPT